MDKLEWLKERQKGIGGSDVGAIMGVSKWKSAFEIYLDILLFKFFILSFVNSITS